jgi:hypothetical protein
MRPQTLRLTIGTTGRWIVTLRYQDTLQPVLDTYTGNEPLNLQITEGAYGEQSLSSESRAEWRGRLTDRTVVTGASAAAIAKVTITVDDIDTTALGVGTFGLSVILTDGSEPIEVYHAALVIEPA